MLLSVLPAVSNDFPAQDLVYLNTNASAWGPENNISSLYVSYNSTYAFFGLNAQYVNNGFIFFIGNNTDSGKGTYNMTDLNAWNRNIIFTHPVNAFFANYAGGSSQSYAITSSLSASNTTPYASEDTNINYYGKDSVEFALPLNEIFGNETGNVTMSVSAFIIGGSGSWVGTGIPYKQSGKYNSGNSIAYFTVNNFINLSLSYEKKPVSQPGKINLDIIYNDHQPLYTSVNSTYWMLPWAAVHLEEYAEQALILQKGYRVNVTYSLSGSLLLQMDAIRDGNYNNSYLMAALIPQSQWNNTVYTEITHYGDTFLESFVQGYAYNTTTVRDILEYNLSFNSPSWVYSSDTPAGAEYAHLLSLETAGKTLNNTDLTDALVEFFLWSVSYPIISGQLGIQYRNMTLLPMYNQTSFNIGEIPVIASYYPVEAKIALQAFSSDAISPSHSGNAELMTTPFDHPILPLLLQSNWTDANGAEVYKGVWGTDVEAQLNIGRDIFYNNFGYYPVGQWTPEQAVSNAIVPYLYDSGVRWTSTDQAVLQESGILNSNLSSVQYMETLYQPYKVSENGSYVYVLFRDSTLSNDWGFNYGSIAGSQGNWAAVDDFMSYLKNVYYSIPSDHRNNTLVTVAIDGENWMFESPFPEDAVPFLEDLYTAIEQNSTWLNSVTPQQYLAANHTYTTISYLPTGSWNYQGFSGSVSPYLTQWAGHPTQDQTWIQLTEVRKMVENFGQEHNLSQPVNLTNFSEAMSYPYMYDWNTATLQQRYDEAWFSIYAAEGSDYYFSFDPGDQNLYAQNDIVFDHEVRLDMANALEILGLPLTPYLNDSWKPPVIPTHWGNNQTVTPAMNGNILRTLSFPVGTGYSISNSSDWSGSYVYNYSLRSGNVSLRYEFNSSDLFILVSGPGIHMRSIMNGHTVLQIYFSNIDPGRGTLVGLGVPGSELETNNGDLLHFASEYYLESNFTLRQRGLSNLSFYRSVNGSWIHSGQVGYGIVSRYAEFEIPFSSVGLNAQDYLDFSVNIVSHHGHHSDLLGPMMVTIPQGTENFKLISSIRNRAPSNGPGNYVYPTNTVDYPPDSVRMRWVNVSVSPTYAEFSITFGNLSNVFDGPFGFSQPIVDIYVHTSNTSSGNTAMLPGPNAKVTQSFAWQWVIQADGFPQNAYVQNYSGFVDNSGYFITSNLSLKEVNIFVPLATIGNNITKYGYVIVAGIQDGYGINGWDPVYSSPTEYQGGGSQGPNAPNIFSYIAPYDVNTSINETQQSILSSYTTESMASLPGIYLPRLSSVTASEQEQSEKFPSVVKERGYYEAYYYYSGRILQSKSVMGYSWTEPTTLLYWGNNITGLTAVDFRGGVLLVVTGYHRYSLLLGNDHIINYSSPQRIYSSSLTVIEGVPLIILQTEGNVTILSLNGSSLMNIEGNYSSISSASMGHFLYLSYVVGKSVVVSTFSVIRKDSVIRLQYLFSNKASLMDQGISLEHTSTSVNAFGHVFVAVQENSYDSVRVLLISFTFHSIFVTNVTSNTPGEFPDLLSGSGPGLIPSIALVSFDYNWELYLIHWYYPDYVSNFNYFF